jgi:hypothetical protein
LLHLLLVLPWCRRCLHKRPCSRAVQSTSTRALKSPLSIRVPTTHSNLTSKFLVAPRTLRTPRSTTPRAFLKVCSLLPFISCVLCVLTSICSRPPGADSSVLWCQLPLESVF